MAKDRFSKFKRANWDKQFKYGSDSLAESNKRSKMEKSVFDSCCKLLKYPLTQWELNFINSIINNKTQLTLKQSKSLTTIILKYKTKQP
jgi:hypothetical protein